MILRTVGLENFGLYSGRDTVFDLAPRRLADRERPIVLVGGRNGVGKTSLLEGVRLALYGRRALGTRVGQAQYDEYLRSRIHRPAGAESAPSGAAVELEFDYAEDGVVHRYRVRRAWSARGRAVVEDLDLRKDGQAVAGVPREEWQHFLQELIPPGVSQLFFFDGEKIQEIADGNHEDEQLASAVRGLLGVELIARLRTDLGLYLARQQRGDQGALAARIEALSQEAAVLDEQITTAAEELAQLSSVRESQARAADQVRRRFVAEGGDLAARRTQLGWQLDGVAGELDRRQAELRELANGLLPFAVAPRLTRRFHAALREGAAFASAAQRAEFVGVLRAALKRWRRDEGAAGAPRREAAWDAAHWRDLHDFLARWADDPGLAGADPARGRDRGAATGEADPEAPAALVPPPVVADRATLLAALDALEATTRPRAEALADALEVLGARQADLEGQVLRADAGSSSAVLDELRLADQRLGATEATLAAREAELKRLRGRRAQADREREQVLAQQTEQSSAGHRSALAVSASRALASYEQRLLERKLAQLRGEFVRCFNRLARKGEVVSDVHIDPESFAVTLVDRAGRVLPKSALSAGEKQVYAIAVLWALARTSGRALPMIIDTPLARLDSEHRAHLVERYFPSVSHQVIMLSTDTEVDAPLLASLAPHVSHAYRLDYEATRGRTLARKGYFWPESTSAAGADELGPDRPGADAAGAAAASAAADAAAGTSRPSGARR